MTELSKKWDNSSWKIDLGSNEFAESKLLKLNCDKALSLINWRPSLNFKKTMGLTADWYYGFYKEKNFNVFEASCKQIQEFISKRKI